MKTALLVLVIIAATAYCSVIPIKGEKKLVDSTFLTRQKQILDLYVGISHSDYYTKYYKYFDFETNYNQFLNDAVKYFWNTYKQGGYLPKDGIFTMSSHETRKATIYLFDVFFFAKDFDTFYSAACWAKKHIHPMQFAYVYTLALMHREDCRYFEFPPLYEIFPTYYVPKDVINKVYSDKMYDLKEGKYYFNNTGYEYNYHSQIFGGPLPENAYYPHLDYKISYFTEDIGANLYYSLWHFRYPSWMNPEKYKKSYWFKRGEGFYYTHQQLFARYSLERMSNELPYVEPLFWDEPIKTGYTPKISHFNGQSFYPRPDNFNMKYFNKFYVDSAKTYEQRLYKIIDAGSFMEVSNSTMYHINNEDGIDILGKAVYGAYDRPLKKYLGSYYHAAMDALSYGVSTFKDHSYLGGVTTYAGTSMRDPVFYNYLNRLVSMFQWHKKNFTPYTRKELGFPGVQVLDFETEKLQTYFERYEFEITNALPLNDYKENKFYASQYRINHKPFAYKVMVDSDNAYDGMIRIFIGPKYDSEGHVLTLEQKRMMLFEFDRFPVKMTAGKNVFERNSKDSPVFYGDYEGFRKLYNKFNQAIKSQEPYYVNEKITCGMPDRFQLPRGWKIGQLYSFYVVVSPFEKKYEGETKDFYATCGSYELYDYRALGYPFDRPVYEWEFSVGNIFNKDIPIYHKEDEFYRQA